MLPNILIPFLHKNMLRYGYAKEGIYYVTSIGWTKQLKTAVCSDIADFEIEWYQRDARGSVKQPTPDTL